MVSAVDRDRVCEIIGYVFTDENLLIQALTSAHRIVLENGSHQSLENNRGLAAVGQAVIVLQLTEDWMDRPEPLGEE